MTDISHHTLMSSRQVYLLALFASLSGGSIVGFLMWLAIQVFHP